MLRAALLALSLSLLPLACLAPAHAATATAVSVRGYEQVVINADDDATGDVVLYVSDAARWRVQCVAASGTPTFTLQAKGRLSATYTTIATEASVASALFTGDGYFYALKVSFSGATGTVTCWAAAEVVQ